VSIPFLSTSQRAMPFLAEDRFDVSTKDLISWAFDDASYDFDKPVGYVLIYLVFNH
jgi:hypothetical protein